MTDLDQTRIHLAEIPGMYAQLPRFIQTGSVPADPNEGSGKHRPGSTAPARLEVIDLLAVRKEAGMLAWLGWDGGEPDRDLRHGVHGTLDLWGFLILSELPDVGRRRDEPEVSDDPQKATMQELAADVTRMCEWLAFDLAWIVQHHADFAKSISRVHRALQHACGIRPPLKLACPRCGEPAFIDETARFLVCQLDAAHEVGIDQIETRWRRRPARPTREITKEFPITAKELHNASRGARPRITPANGPDGDIRWYPWDVLRLLNPDLAEVIDARDHASATTRRNSSAD